MNVGRKKRVVGSRKITFGSATGQRILLPNLPAGQTAGAARIGERGFAADVALDRKRGGRNFTAGGARLFVLGKKGRRAVLTTETGGKIIFVCINRRIDGKTRSIVLKEVSQSRGKGLREEPMRDELALLRQFKQFLVPFTWPKGF